MPEISDGLTAGEGALAKKTPGYSEAAAEIEEILEKIDASDTVDIVIYFQF